MFGDDKKNGSSWAFSTGGDNGSSWAYSTGSSGSSPFSPSSHDSSWAYSTGGQDNGSSWAYSTGSSQGNGSGWAYGSGSHSLGSGYAHSYLSHCNYGQRPILNSAYAPTYHTSFYSGSGSSDAFKPVSWGSNNANSGVFRIDPWFKKS